MKRLLPVLVLVVSMTSVAQASAPKADVGFKGRFNRAGTKTVVKGKYNGKLTKVKGTLRVTGLYAGYTKCDSGKLKWVTN